MKREGVLLILLIIIFFSINYKFLDNFLIKSFDSREAVFVNRTIDGDTLKFGNQSVRLLGINCPEKGEKYYAEAGEYLRNRIVNKTVYLEYGREKYDLYKRILAYVFFDDKNINIELIENGYANFYFPVGKDRYYSEFKNAWEKCILKNINLCEKSTHLCAECIILKEFDSENEIIILRNECNFDCDLTNWRIKDEGRKNFFFPKLILSENQEVKVITGEGKDSNSTLFWRNEKYVWTQTGDTMFLRDNDSKLVLWQNY